MYDAQKDDTRKCVYVNAREQLGFLRQFYIWLDAWSFEKKNGLSDLTSNSS